MNTCSISQFSLPPLPANPAWDSLCDYVSILQERMHREGYETIFVGGGSSRAILDHIFFHRPLRMRDLDIFAVANQQVTRESAIALAEKLASPETGQFDIRNQRPRPRANPALGPRGLEYVAGEGFFLVKTGVLADISIYHHPEDLRLNGIFNVDKIMIPLRMGSDLRSFAREIHRQNVSPANLGLTNLVIDSFDGYISWCDGLPLIVHWAEIERDAILNAIRVLSTFAKAGATEIPSHVAQRLRKLIGAAATTNQLQVIRSFIKILEGDHAVRLFTWLRQIGVIEKLSPTLDSALAELTPTEWKRLLAKRAPSEAGFEPQNGAAKGELALANILALVPAVERVRLVSGPSIREVCPELFARVTESAFRESFALSDESRKKPQANLAAVSGE